MPGTPRAKDQLDPLYIIFEQHLFHFEDPDSDRKTFILGIVQDYLKFLGKSGVQVPKPLEGPVVEELARQVQTMLVKKIYGSAGINSYRESTPSKTRRTASHRYSRLKQVK